MPWLPADFTHPTRVEVCPGFHLRPIRADDTPIDYPAVMGSRESLWASYGPIWGWPPEGMTEEQDREDLAHHEREIAAHASFNYALLNDDETGLFGCVYLDPPERSDSDAEISWWVIDELRGGPVHRAFDEFVPSWTTSACPPAWCATPTTPGCGMRDTVYSMLSPRVPELRSLELLLAVDRAGSIGAAAHEFGLSQQAVSARIARTEALVGTALVNRDAHGSTLTHDGRLVAQWARQIIASAQELDIGIAALRGDHEAHLRVAANMTVAEYLLPGWLVRFYAQRASTDRTPINVEMIATNTDTALRMVTEGRAELAFVEGQSVEGPGVPGKIGFQEVAADELFVVATPNHPWARRADRRVSVRELTRTPLVLREAGSGCRQVLTAQLAHLTGSRAGITEPALELPSNAAVRAACVAGAGPSVLTSYAVADDITAGRLVRLAVPELDLRRHLLAVWVGRIARPSGPARDLLASIAARLKV